MTKKWSLIIKKCIFHPLTLFNALGIVISNKLKTKIVPFYPITIDIEPATICNFKCKFCQVHTLKRELPFLTYENFLKIIKQFKYTLRVKIQGMGEPLLNKEIFKMIKYLKKEKIYTILTTNASLLNKINCKKLIESGINQIYVSLDGATAETFEKIRIGGKFKEITENIKRLILMRKNKQPKVTAWVVGSKDNIKELPNIVKLSKELGIDDVGIQHDISFWGKEEFKQKFKKLILNKNEAQEQIKKAKYISKKIKIKLKIYEGDKYTNKNKCSWPWTSTYISAEGKIIPCCVRADPSVLNFGSIFEKKFKEIWNSRQYQAIRKSIKNNKIWSYCKDCYSKKF